MDAAEPMDFRSFVASCVSEKQNDSVDSGVCPSPAEGFQNYDEAFPPLSAFTDETEFNLPSWQSVKRPADPSVYSFAPSPITFVDGTNSSSDRTTIAHSASPLLAGATPIKRPKLQVLNDITNRSLRSCPDLHKSFHQPNNIVGAGSGGGTGVTFCCPMVTTPYPLFNNAKVSSAGGAKTAQASPQFVVPKCFKVGSWPMRSGKGCKHANDVPFWSCTEWFCTVHKGVEFGLLSAKVGADAARTLAPPTQTTCSNSNSSSSSFTNNNTLQHQHQQSAVFNQKDAVVTTTAAATNSRCSSAALSAEAANCDSMFDAPRFILHIINENDNVDDFKGDICQDYPPMNKTQIVDNNNEESLDLDAYWIMTANSGLPEFTFTPYSNNGNSNANSTNNNSMQPNMNSSFPQQEVGFCLPKFDLPSAEQQCKIQQSTTCANHLLFNASPFNKISDQQHMLLQQQQQPPTVSSFLNLNNNNNNVGVAADVAGVGGVAQSMAVPINPNTHFVPIRSESMEDAYYPKPGFDEEDSFTSLIDESDYYIYRDRCSDAHAAAALKICKGGNALLDCGAPATVVPKPVRPSPGGSTGQGCLATTRIGGCRSDFDDESNAEEFMQITSSRQQQKMFSTDKSAGVVVKRSLPLKFKASLPAKTVQTDDETAECGNSASGLIDNGLTDAEFEIWNVRPTTLNSNLLSSIQWPEHLGGDTPSLPWQHQQQDQQVPKIVKAGTCTISADKTMTSPMATVGFNVVDECRPSTLLSARGGTTNQLEMWQRQDEQDEDLLLQFVSNISLISPLEATESLL